MAVEAGRTYAGRVRHGARMVKSKEKGTLGFEIPLECEDGDITHTLWITSSTRDKVLKTFNEVLGVSLAKLQDENFVANEISDFIADREVEFTTKEEEYNGNYYVRVQWLNRPKGSGSGGTTDGAASMAAAFFQGKPVHKPAPAADFPARPQQRQIADDDIPF